MLCTGTMFTLENTMKENKSRQKLYPISSSFILFTSKHQPHYICLSTGRKESSSNKHKGNIQPRWKHRHRPFWADFKTKKKKKKNSWVSWMCETDNLRISSVSRLLSHSGLIGPRGAYTHTCGSCKVNIPPPTCPPTHPSLLHLDVVTVWLHFRLLGSDIHWGRTRKQTRC